MEEVLAALATLIDAFVKRSRPESRVLPVPSRLAVPAVAARVAVEPGPAIVRAAVATPVSRPMAEPVPEAGLVTGLFASPRTLAAAFIVAEVLAKPVALRDS